MSGSAARAAASLLALATATVLLGGPSRASTSGAPGTPADTLPVTAASLVPASDPLPAPDGAPILRIAIEPRGIFDPAPRGLLGPLYRLADRLHVRTRDGTIRRQLVFAPGEPWSEPRGRESERALRALHIFNSARVTAQPSGDSALVRVETRDAWTTSPEFTIERGGSRSFGSIGFTERNLLGRAKFLAFAYREEPAGISRSIELADPAIVGSRVRASLLASRGASGTIDAASVEMPFYAEDARYSFGVRAERSDADLRLYEAGAEAAILPRRVETVEVFVGGGRRQDGTIGRLVASMLWWDRWLGPSTLAPGAPAAFAGGDEWLRLRRFALEARLWRPRFVERTNVERLDTVEDIDLGHSVAITGGYSARALGGSENEGYAAVRMGTAMDAGAVGFGWVRLGGSTRLIDGPLEASARLDARWVNQALPRHTLVLSALGARGWNTARDFQLVVGGLNGLRAHGVHAVSGDRLWRLNAESRWRIASEIAQLVSIGAAGFWDSARAWGPGSDAMVWQHDVGFGLRLAPSRSSFNRVVRLDLAWQVFPRGATPREAVFSISSSQAF